MKFVLEPMLLALDEHISEPEFILYINQLIQWQYWIERYPDDVYLLSDTCDILAFENLYPIYNIFNQLVEKYKIDYIQASDLNKIICKLVSSAQKLDKHEALDIEGNYSFRLFRINALQKPDTYSTNMWKTFERSMRCLFCQCVEKGYNAESYVLFSKSVKGNYNIDIEFDMIDYQCDKIISKSDAINVLCCSSLKDFFKNRETPFKILRTHRHKNDLSLAIRIVVYQKGALDSIQEAFSKYNFYIQNTFYRDYQQAHYDSQPRFLSSFVDAMGNCLLGNNMRDREDFRTGKGGNNKQLVRNDYLAWRWFVTRSVKMQYWQNDDEYRFANIKEHDIFECQWED